MVNNIFVYNSIHFKAFNVEREEWKQFTSDNKLYLHHQVIIR